VADELTRSIDGNQTGFAFHFHATVAQNTGNPPHGQTLQFGAGGVRGIDQVMKRHAFTMKLKPGMAEEYRRRHDAIWPELATALRAAGMSDYSIFLDEKTLTLFAVQKQGEPNTIASLPDHPIVRKWWAYMAPLMETHPDNAPVCGELTEVFHLD